MSNKTPKSETKAMRQAKIWVVEIKFEDTGWMTTTGVGLNRDDAREKSKEWTSRNSCIARVRKYEKITT